MSNRSEIEDVVRRVYAARKEGDIDAICRHFHPDATFQIAGAPESRIAVQTACEQDFREVLTNIVKTFEFRDYKIHQIAVEGNRAVVNWGGVVHSNATGDTVKTELLDLIELKDGRIASFKQFLDTALCSG